MIPDSRSERGSVRGTSSGGRRPPRRELAQPAESRGVPRLPRPLRAGRGRATRRGCSPRDRPPGRRALRGAVRGPARPRRPRRSVCRGPHLVDQRVLRCLVRSVARTAAFRRPAERRWMISAVLFDLLPDGSRRPSRRPGRRCRRRVAKGGEDFDRLARVGPPHRSGLTCFAVQTVLLNNPGNAGGRIARQARGLPLARKNAGSGTRRDGLNASRTGPSMRPAPLVRPLSRGSNGACRPSRISPRWSLGRTGRCRRYGRERRPTRARAGGRPAPAAIRPRSDRRPPCTASGGRSTAGP